MRKECAVKEGKNKYHMFAICQNVCYILKSTKAAWVCYICENMNHVAKT